MWFCITWNTLSSMVNLIIKRLYCLLLRKPTKEWLVITILYFGSIAVLARMLSTNKLKNQLVNTDVLIWD